tara:strand:+ start:25357 stop:26412 length:1056 start_codon:yes stop_codon:yes gene_type:complete
MKNILITGGAGFIGSHTCLVLLEAGYRLTVIDSFVNSSPLSLSRVQKILNLKETNNQITIFEGDIRDQIFLNNIFKNCYDKNNQIDAVIHFAGLKAVADSVKDPLIYWDVNVNGTIKLLNTMIKYDCRILVFSSSATIYGVPQKVPIPETAEIKPINPYGNTKASVERILNDCFNSKPNFFKFASLRYFNPVGAHKSGFIGEDPSGKPSNLFPYITQVAVGTKSILNVFGNNWNTPDGTPIRDFIHVMDLAEGHLCALECLYSQDPQFLKVNLGTGIGHSVLNVIQTFENASKCSIPYEYLNRREGDVEISVADVSLAKKKMKWIASRTLFDCCIDSWKWQLGNPHGYGKK